jgi:hypothetical protein
MRGAEDEDDIHNSDELKLGLKGLDLVTLSHYGPVPTACSAERPPSRS